MYYSGTVSKSPCHFSKSRETLEKVGAIGISPVFNELPIRVEIKYDEHNKPYMNVCLGGKDEQV